jgi:hypothetical protein
LTFTLRVSVKYLQSNASRASALALRIDMVTKIRKTRSDTVAGSLEAHRAAQLPDPLTWPQDVALPAAPDDERKVKTIFSEVQAGRNRNHWRPHHSRQVAEYALLTGQIDKLMAFVIEHGPTAKGPSGHVTRSPALDAMSMLTSQRNQLTKALGLIGQRAEQDNDAKAQNGARDVYSTHNRDIDGLLASASDLL